MPDFDDDKDNLNDIDDDIEKKEKANSNPQTTQDVLKPNRQIVTDNSDPIIGLNTLYHEIRDTVTVYGTDQDDLIYYAPNANHLKMIVDDPKLLKKEKTMIYEGGKGNDIYVVAPELNYSTYIYESPNDRKVDSTNSDVLVIVLFENLEGTPFVDRSNKISKTFEILYNSQSQNFLSQSSIRINFNGIEDIVIINLANFEGSLDKTVLSNITKDMIIRSFYWDDNKNWYGVNKAEDFINKYKVKNKKNNESSFLLPQKTPVEANHKKLFSLLGSPNIFDSTVASR